MAKLPWTHNIILTFKIKDKNKRFWYANEAANSNWSKVVLDHQIDMALYERKAITNKENNFKNTLVDPQSDLANDLQKDPYIFNLTLLKGKLDAPSIGLLLCKSKNRLTVEYSLKSISKPIGGKFL